MRSLWSPSRYQNSGAEFWPLHRVIQSLDDAFRGLPMTPTEAAAMPVKIDVKEDEKAFYVSADLPGLTEKEVEVTFDDGLLTIRGEKKVERDEKKDTWHIVERSYGSFARRVSLSAAIDASKIEAKFDKGVLSVSLPKQPQEQTAGRKIEIKSN
jgi:HSP20 family protein